MTTRDTFLDALTMPTAPVKARTSFQPKGSSDAMPWCEHCQGYHFPTARCIDKPAPAKPVALPPDPDPPKLNSRPDFADDIDRIVADMITFGQVVFDAEAQMFKAPARRRIRFA